MVNLTIIAELAEADVHSIDAAMQQLSDGRSTQGRQYELVLVLTYLLLAKAAGETVLQALAEWIRLRADWLSETNLPHAQRAFAYHFDRALAQLAS